MTPDKSLSELKPKFVRSYQRVFVGEGKKKKLVATVTISYLPVMLSEDSIDLLVQEAATQVAQAVADDLNTTGVPS